MLSFRPVSFLRCNVKVLWLLSALILLVFSGCGEYSLGATDEELGRYVASGFRTDIHPRLFISRTSLWGPSRLEALLSRLGYNRSERDLISGAKSSKAGTCLRLMSRGIVKASEYLSFCKTGEAEPLAFCEEFGVRGGTRYAYTSWKNRKRTEPIVIFDPSEPDEPLATVNVDAGVVGIYVGEERLYLLCGYGDENNRMRCWEFKRKGKSLELDWTYDVNIPARYGWGGITDFDAQTETLLIEMKREMPDSMFLLNRHWTFLYDMKTGKFTEIGLLSRGYVGFLDPNVFGHALENLPPRSE